MDRPNLEPAIERRIVTILFADLVGFTTLSERLDAEDVASVQNAYFGLVRDTIARYGGQLEKFIGDAAMAAFGLLRSRDDDAERAVRAGLALTNAVEALGARLGLEVGELRLRVGVNTGEVVTTEQGPDRGRITGDAVNSAARLQTAAQPGQVLLGELTALAVADVIELQSTGPMQLKGKAEPVRPSLAVAVRLRRSREEAMGGLHAPLLGRSKELEALSQAAERQSVGAGERVLLVAPPGVGKTRLVEEFVAGLTTFRVARARLLPDAGSPFEAVRQLLVSASGNLPAPALLEWLMARLRETGIGQARSQAIRDDVATLIALPGSSDSELDAGETATPATSADQAGTFGAWVTALDAADDGPMLWLIEDLHWAGPDMLAFLDAVQGRSRHAGRFVLATARPSLLERIADVGAPSDRQPKDSDRPPDWTIHHLAALEASDAGALIEALVGLAVPVELVARIVERSDGNCLFIEELLRTWVSVGTLAPGVTSGTWQLSVPVEAAPLPVSVQAIYAGQLDDLPGAARTAARRASVAGRQFPEAALKALGVDDVVASLGTLRLRALISGPLQVPITGDGYTYRHALLRDAAYASLARAERARMHVQLARWLEATAGPRAEEVAEEIATHYEAAVASTPALAREVADDLDRRAATDLAATWLERAGDRAFRQFATTAARSAFERSLRMTDAAERLAAARRWTRLGEATAGDGDLDDAADAFATAGAGFRVVLSDPAVGDEDRTIARRGLATAAAAEAATRYGQIRFAEAQAVAEAALEATGSDDPRTAVPLLLARLLGVEGLTNDYESLAKEATEILTLATASGDPQRIFEARRAVLRFGGNAGSATAEDFLELAADARSLGRWQEATGAVINAAGLSMDRDPARARALSEEAERLAEARGLAESLAWIGQLRAELGLRDGDWSAVRADCLKVFEITDLHRYHRAAVRTWFVATSISEPTGDRELLERAARWFDDHRGIFPDSPYARVHHAAVSLRLAAVGLANPPDLELAALLPGFAIGETSPSWLCSIERIVRAWLERGQIEAASEAAERFCSLDLGDAPALTAASRALVQAWTARAAGRPQAAAKRFEAALSAARGAPAPWWIARALRGMHSVGRATLAEEAEAAAIESRLGVVPVG